MPLPVRLKIQEMLWPLCVKNTNPFNSKIATVMYAIDFPRIFPQNMRGGTSNVPPRISFNILFKHLLAGDKIRCLLLSLQNHIPASSPWKG